MKKFISTHWVRLFNREEKLISRFESLAYMLSIILVLILLVLLVVYFVRDILPLVVGSLFIIYLFFSDYIDSYISKKQREKQEEAWYRAQQVTYIWNKIAFLIIPDVEQVTSISLVPEEMIYCNTTQPNGLGYYFATPRLLTDQECKRLRRQIVLRLYGRIGKTRAQMFEQKIVVVTPDYIFIRSDHQVESYFSTLA